MLSQGISILGYVLLWFLMVPGKPWMFMFALPFFSFGIGGLFTLMMSMTADVCDLDELATGKRREGIFGAIYWWMVKLGFAVAGLLSGAIMAFVAFTPGAAVQPDGRGGRPAPVLLRRAHLRHAAGDVVHARLRPRREARHGGARRARAAQAARRRVLVPGLGRAGPGWREHGLLLPGAEPSPLAGKTADEIRALYAEQFQRGLYGLCFSAYGEGQRAGDQLQASQVGRRIDLIAPHTRWVRSFACTEGHEVIPRLARAKGLKTMVGAWISHDRERNEREIEALIQLAKDGQVDIAVVGNEVLLRGELPEPELLAYVARVKAAVPDDVPVGCVDAYFQFLERPALTAACDVLLPNCYPFWEGADIDRGRAVPAPHARAGEGRRRRQARHRHRDRLARQGPGRWPGPCPRPTTRCATSSTSSSGAGGEGIKLFYFSSFDEPWKLGAGRRSGHAVGPVGQGRAAQVRRVSRCAHGPHPRCARPLPQAGEVKIRRRGSTPAARCAR